jgi:peptidoglycan/LPS O-acetylase OafA/YrhL
MPYYSGVGFGGNLIFLSFAWVAGLRLARSSGKDATALRDIGFIFGGHIALAVLIKFASCFKHHDVSGFFSHDLIVYVMQGITLVFVYLVFKYFVIADRPALHRSRFLRMLGDISYPLYLLHAAIYGILLHFGLRIPLLLYLTAVLVSAFIYWSLDFYSKKRHQQVGTT